MFLCLWRKSKCGLSVYWPRAHYTYLVQQLSLTTRLHKMFCSIWPDARGFKSRSEQEKCFPFIKSKIMGAHSHSYAKSSGKYVPRVKRPASESDLLLPCSAEIKNEWRYTSTPPIPSNRVQENFIFYFTFRAKQNERIREIFYI